MSILLCLLCVVGTAAQLPAYATSTSPTRLVRNAIVDANNSIHQQLDHTFFQMGASPADPQARSIASDAAASGLILCLVGAQSLPRTFGFDSADAFVVRPPDIARQPCKASFVGRRLYVSRRSTPRPPFGRRLCFSTASSFPNARPATCPTPPLPSGTSAAYSPRHLLRHRPRRPAHSCAFKCGTMSF
jgi:hypothetical protein